MSLATAYPPHVTNPVPRLVARLEAASFTDVRYVAVDTYQCDYCAEIDALVQARLYTPHDATDEDGDYAETCLACAHTVATEFARLGDMPVTVELDRELAR